MKKKVLISVLFFLFCYSVHSQRIVQTINSAWRFTSNQYPEVSTTVNIPHTWNSEDSFQDGKKYYRGVGTYEKKIFIPEDWRNRRICLKFEGANQITKLWTNDQFVGEHRGGYTGFIFDITDHLQPGKENHIKIECDNSYNPDIPPLEADFNFYGGIYRDLYLIVSSPIHFEINNEATGNLLVRTPNVSENKAEIKIEGQLKNHSKQTKHCMVEVKIDRPDGSQEVVIQRKFKLGAEQQEAISFDYEIKQPELWSPENPALYRVEASILDVKTREQLDDFTTSFGCRWFRIDPEKGFFLNGKHYKLIGVNRHQDYKGFGNALPNSLHEKDYRMIKAMGSNFVRIAHYPHDPEAYRLCDELGLLVWSEIPVINDVTDSKAYHQACLKMQREQILQFFNHPSVIMWGYMNEIFIRMVFNGKLSEDEKKAKINTTLELARKLNQETKDLDPDRLTVMALHNNSVYNETGIADIPDVIGWNLYFGWYDATLEDLGKFLDEQHRRYPNRPLIISEYGPGADVRIQTDAPKPWDYSEGYQLKSHVSYFRQVMERPYIVGISAWNFADFGSSGRQDALPFINQKGLLNFDRSPKDIYHYYQARLLKDPYLYIAGENQKERYCIDKGTGKGKILVSVFSNQEELELQVDDTLKIRSSVTDGLAVFTLFLPEGDHQLKAQAHGVSHHRNIKVSLRSGLLSDLKTKALRVNVGTHCNYTDPITNEVWISDQEYVPGSWGYIGGEVFQKSKNKFQGTPINILGTNKDPLFQTMREDMDGYRFDVGKGVYRVRLLFAEHNLKATEKLIYNLSHEETESIPGLRSFSIYINQTMMISDLNLARDFGRGRAVEISFDVKTSNEILIEFGKIAGKPILSGIKIEKR